ncbi:MAG TPA: AIPR family protein [Terriglobales bacterium]|nr:AIPR family protein [Terriglobales bacterium]
MFDSLGSKSGTMLRMSFLVHQKNLLHVLSSDLKEKTENHGIPLDKAFNRIAAEWMGYQLEDQHFVDGAYDKGIDFWFQSDLGFDIFQAKTHVLDPDGELCLDAFDKAGIDDLQRAKNFLLGPPVDIRNEELKNFWHRWQHAIDSRRGAEDEEPLKVNFALVLLGDGLYPGAVQDFDAFEASLESPEIVRDVPVQFSASVYGVETLIERRWREENRTWKDIAGAKRNTVDLHPETVEDALIKNNTAVFYCRCYDLVRAYQSFGYQLFEPNVRCNITVSKVNAAIRDSVESRVTREEFRFLNNGVTIVCKAYSKPSANKPYFRVTEPGVVNGLQTVYALQEAYQKLSNSDKDHFEKSCYVLVRLLQEQSVRDLSRMVRATNTQNPMQPRNLVSNNSEQIVFEKLFAGLGWFYERKQGAWDAYAADPRRWRTLSGKSKESFQFTTGGRPRVRRIDNELLGQCWLSFIGFSEEANHAKRNIFEKDSWYDLIFLSSPTKHSADANYDLDATAENSINHAPAPSLMLCAYLAREFARKVVPTQKENREAAIQRLGIDSRSPKEKIDAQLQKDTEYLLGQVMSGMSFLFVEFFGSIIFRSLDFSSPSVGQKLIENCSLQDLRTKPNFDEVRERVIAQEFNEFDILAVSWCAFKHCMEELVGGSWLTEYLQSRSRNRFNYSVETRMKLQKVLAALQQYTERKELTRPWATGIRPPDGLFGFIRRALDMQSQMKAKAN